MEGVSSQQMGEEKEERPGNAGWVTQEWGMWVLVRLGREHHCWVWVCSRGCSSVSLGCPCRACSGDTEGLDVLLVPAERGVLGDGMSCYLLGQ